MIASTGQSWQQVRDEWDIPRLEAWSKYSESHPPLHVLFAAYCGFKPPPKISKTADEQTAEALMAFLSDFPGIAKK